MTTKDEALKLALEFIERTSKYLPTAFDDEGLALHAAVREALAEQPAQQQEPVATDWERIARVQDAKLRAMCNEPGGFEKLCEVMDKYERTSPPASKPWVGLSTIELDEIDAPIRERGHATIAEIYQAIEAKLREKNA